MRSQKASGVALVLALLMAAVAPGSRAGAVALTKVHGLNFSPYIDGQDPRFGAQISLLQIQTRLQLIAPYTVWVRSFGSTHGLEHFPSVAKGLGLKVAAGAWLGTNAAENALEIQNLIAAANAGHVDMAIVGAEALLRGDVTPEALIAYINQVRQAIPAGIPVATADTFHALLANPNVIAAGDVVLPNIYPYWQGVALPNAMCSLESAYQQVVAAAGGKPVIIAEAGWPSAGGAQGAAVASPSNAATYFNQFASWALANSVPYLYFAGLDESWKASVEGEVGAHWGIFDENGVMKPGMQSFFDGNTVAVECNGTPGGPGTPEIHFEYVPPIGSANRLNGRVLHASTADYRVAHYIKVAGGWWVKPTFAQPLTAFQPDGSYSTPVATGGSDVLATDITAFVVLASYSPPLLAGAASLPAELLTNSVASTTVSRTSDSISGRILDHHGNPIWGALITLSGADSASAFSSPDGRYSFPTLTAGSHTVVPSFPGYVFVPSSQVFPNVGGAQVADFSGAPFAPWGPPLVDLDGDGNADVFTYRLATGVWARQIALAGGGFAASAGGWVPGWSILPATFDADALTDFFLFNATTGDWYKMLNTGAGFSVQATGAWWPNWQKFVLDLNGDGISDLFLYDPASGQWFRSVSTPTGFTYVTGWWNPGWEITPMNLNGDAFGDLFLFDRGTGRWFWVVGQADGSFTYPQVSYWQPDWALYPGDFNGDGRTDLFLYREQAGEHYVAINTGAGFTYSYGAGWVAGWTPMVMDLNADGLADLFLYNKTTGLWFEMLGNGAGQFTVGGSGAWIPGWDVYPTDFNADGRADLLLYKPGTGDWYQAWNIILGGFSYFSGNWQTGLTIHSR